MLGAETSESGKLTWKTHRILIGFTREDGEFRYVSLPEDDFCKVVDVFSWGMLLCLQLWVPFVLGEFTILPGMIGIFYV